MDLGVLPEIKFLRNSSTLYSVKCLSIELVFINPHKSQKDFLIRQIKSAQNMTKCLNCQLKSSPKIPYLPVAKLCTLAIVPLLKYRLSSFYFNYLDANCNNVLYPLDHLFIYLYFVRQ